MNRVEYAPTLAECEAPNCDALFQQRAVGEAKRYCSGKCRARHTAQRARAAAGFVPAHMREGAPQCTVEGCRKSKLSRGMCSMHYSRWRKSGDVGPAESKFRPGEWRADPNGYIYTCENGEKVLQHRVVMEQILGRPLHPWENVHHVNGRRDDNDPSNLELWVKPQPAGQRAIDLARWVLETYPELVAAVAA